MSGEALLEAARNGNVIELNHLLDIGISVNYRNVDNQTALAYAAALGHEAIVEVLLVRGADHKIKAKKGGTALDMARRNNRVGCIAALENHSFTLRLLNSVESDRAIDIQYANESKRDGGAKSKLKLNVRDHTSNVLQMTEHVGLKVAPPPTLERNISAESEAIVLSYSTKKDRQDKVREALFVIKRAFEDGRISLIEKGILKDQLSDERLYNDEILLKLSREEERVLSSEIASRLNIYQEQMSKEISILECAVCLCNYNIFGSLVPHQLANCGHTFCIGCIRNLLASRHGCPECRRELPRNESDIHVNYSLLAIVEQKVSRSKEIEDRARLRREAVQKEISQQSNKKVVKKKMKKIEKQEK